MAVASRSWPRERVLFAPTRTVTSASAMVSRWFALLVGLVGLNQWLHVATGSCPASHLLRRSCRLQSVMYVNDDRADARVKEVTV
jgi:hypothetical protein